MAGIADRGSSCKEKRMTQSPLHITVCICTFKRRELLQRLLIKLELQRTGDEFSYSAVVVDNDANRSAQETVALFKTSHSLPVVYLAEPEQNIALARNKAVENASGNFIAFIDDDEFPDDEWLLQMLKTWRTSQADGVLGPVRPHFEEGCPWWVVKSGLCERKTHPTGTVMRSADTRTGNVLFKRELFADPAHRFDPAFGRSGGSDVRFFEYMMQKGHIFVWSNEAVVYETVLPDRWTVSFYLRRAVRKGGLSGSWIRKSGFSGRHLTFALAAACVYTTVLPFAVLAGKHNGVKCLVKSAYHLAWLSGFFGHVHIVLRDDH
ncbi:family 2 glycosyl transferase [Geoanaerobacter pelophilus]|uniref:Family 2 glycosyl transferase n=2 Tax=Geoanaerobacter pelophilus TaxID=60036 RepID=A0ABQ0MDU5_9BACT|nr:family 2 glycosyl transferase [Geoanaerobacter pelophilus]